MTVNQKNITKKISDILRKDVAKLRDNISIQQALDIIRNEGIGEKIIYFYATDADNRLVGVVPTRRLLTAATNSLISEVMIANAISIPQDANVFDAYEFFAKYKFLAFPVVDDDNHIVGVVDIAMFTDNSFDATDRESMDRLFEMIGFHIMQAREASPFRAFRFRFPWLLATIASGTVCALLAGVYEVTLAKSLILAFFLTLVLGLGESVSIQSMTLTIYNLRSRQPDFKWYVQSFFREIGAAMLLGVTCGLVVGLIAWLWRGDGVPAFTIGVSILFTLCSAVFFGLSIPSLLHKLKLDMRIAAGPLTLALTDMSTILIYFSNAKAYL